MSAAASNQGPPFSLRTVLILILVGGCAVAGVVFLSLYGDNFSDPITVQPSSYSRSAIGHKALVETLRRLGVRMVVSRFDSADKARNAGLLVVAEPNGDPDDADLLDSLASLPRALLVLPKWRAVPDPKRPGWAALIVLLPADDVLAVVAGALGKAKLVRHETAIEFEAGHFPGRVKLNAAQFLASENLNPLISGPDGILLGEYAKDGKRLWVLSDPDLLSNQGIDEAGNAEIAVAMIKALLPPEGVVVFDETAHGLQERPNLLHRIFQLPYAMVTIATGVFVLLMVWAGGARFGGAEASEPILAAGKGTLIRNAADLLSLGRSVDMVLSRYLRSVVGEAMSKLRGPSGLSEAAQAGWLDSQAARRGLTRRLLPLREAALDLAGAARPDATRALRLAMELHQWKQEMLNGASRGSSPR